MIKSAIVILTLICLQAKAQLTLNDIKLTDVTTNGLVSVSDFSAKKGIAIIFTSNECAFDNYYFDRIKSLNQKYSSTIQFLLVNSNQGDDDSIEKMIINYAKRKLDIPYLADKDQKLLTILDAKKTPESFLLIPTGEKLSVFYAGAIDDNPQVANDVKENYLKDNIERLLKGQPAKESERAAGCTIRKK